ncbi:MAG: UDP-2,3-diacylglucosamine diphosphatase [Balneola sp.]
MQEQRSIFISDVHLGAFDKVKEAEVEHDLISLINYCCAQKIKIYILGDLFDYWMEYPKINYIPTVGAKVLDAFKEHNERCQPTTFITGNHDNWTYGYFEKMGFDVECNYRIIKQNEYNTLLMHGDGRFGKSDDLLRPFFHGLLRSKYFVKLFQAVLPPPVGISIMKRFSGFSKMNERRTPDPLSKHAKRILKEKDIDFILMGHDHIPRVETFIDGTYINLGTFFHHKTVVLYNNEEYQLVRWSASDKEFVPFTEQSVVE